MTVVIWKHGNKEHHASYTLQFQEILLKRYCQIALFTDFVCTVYCRMFGEHTNIIFYLSKVLVVRMQIHT